MKKQKSRRSLTFSIMLNLINLILIVQVGASLIGFYVFDDTMKKSYQDHANTLATAAAHTIHADRLDEYLEYEGDVTDYQTTRERLQNLADSSGSYVIYIAMLDLEKQERIYVFNIVGQDFDEEVYKIGSRDKASSGFVKCYTELLNSNDTIEYSSYVKKGSIGDYTTTLVPIYDNEHKMVAACSVVMPLAALKEARKSYIHQSLAWAALVSLLTGIFWFFMLRKKFAKPLKKIANETIRFSKERTVHSEALTSVIHSNLEMGQLAEAIEDMEETITVNVEKLMELTKENNRIETELNLAMQIQSNILPQITESFPGRKEIDICTYIKPAREVGGDFYDFFFIDENHFAMVIADVSGKGIPAALYMMVSKAFIKATCMGDHIDAGKILTEVNEKLCENNKINMFVSVWLGILDLTTGKVYAANAGHEYPVIGINGKPMELLKHKHGFVLGGMDGIKESTYTIDLKAGDTLFVYTDGVVEAMNHEEKQFGVARLLETLNALDDRDCKKQINSVVHALDEFTDGAEQFDDTTMLCVRYNGI